MNCSWTFTHKTRRPKNITQGLMSNWSSSLELIQHSDGKQYEIEACYWIYYSFFWTPLNSCQSLLGIIGILLVTQLLNDTGLKTGSEREPNAVTCVTISMIFSSTLEALMGISVVPHCKSVGSSFSRPNKGWFMIIQIPLGHCSH